MTHLKISLVRLNMLVIKVVSFPMYVNVAHVCVGVFVWLAVVLVSGRQVFVG
jgi:hypothetical protein